MRGRTDRAGFDRHWGVQVFRCPGAPFVSLGVHLDWHTPRRRWYVPFTTVALWPLAVWEEVR